MASWVENLPTDILRGVFFAVLVGPEGDHVALERLSTTCQAFRAFRVDPDMVLQLCEAHGFSLRTRERFYPGPNSLCSAEGFYRRVVGPEYALRTDAEFECAVVAGDVDEMKSLLKYGASVHLPDYAQLKQESYCCTFAYPVDDKAAPPACYANGYRGRPRRLRKTACHANGYDSDPNDAATPLLKRAATCGHVKVCALLLRASGGLSAERVMPSDTTASLVRNWGAQRMLDDDERQSINERNELNEAASAAYAHDKFGVLQFLLDEGAVVKPSWWHSEALRYVLEADNAAEGLRVLFRISKPPPEVLSDLLDTAILLERIEVVRELFAQDVRLKPGVFRVAQVCARGQLDMLELLLPIWKEVSRDKSQNDLAHELADGLHTACHFLANPTCEIPPRGRCSLTGRAMGPRATPSVYLAMANRLLDAGTTPADFVGSERREGATLVLACQAGVAPLVSRLLDAGEPPDAADGLPMKFACAQNHVEVIKALNDAMVPVLNRRLRTSRQ